MKLGPVEVDQKGAKVQVGIASVGFQNDGKKLEYTATVGGTAEASVGADSGFTPKSKQRLRWRRVSQLNRRAETMNPTRRYMGGVDRPEKINLFARAKAKFKAIFGIGKNAEDEVELGETAETESSYTPFRGLQDRSMRIFEAGKSD